MHRHSDKASFEILIQSAILPHNNLIFSKMKQSNFSVSELLTAVVNVFDTIAACKEFASCKFGYGFIARSMPTFRAPKRTAAEWLAEFGETMPNIVKVTKCTNARAYDYGKAINRQLTKQGDAANFQSDAMNGYTWVVPNIIKRAEKDGNLQLCVTFKENDRTKFETFYIVADHFATDAELTFIKEHLYKAPNKSVKQSESGIADEDILMVRNFKFSNVIAVGQTPEVDEIWGAITE